MSQTWCHGEPSSVVAYCGKRATVMCTRADGMQWPACDDPRHQDGARTVPIAEWRAIAERAVLAVFDTDDRPDPTTKAYPGDPYEHEAESPRDAAGRMHALLSRARTTVVVDGPEQRRAKPTPDVHVARANAPLRTCKGCGQIRDCRFGYCHACCAPFLPSRGGP